MSRSCALAIAVLAVGCTELAGPVVEVEAGPAPDYADVFVPSPDPETRPRLSPREHLIRLSLDLRGVRPTIAEYERLEAAIDPEAERAVLEELADEMVMDPRFAERVKDLWASIVRTRVEDFPITASSLGLEPDLQSELAESLGEEPLELLAELTREDRPLTGLVLADYTLANELLLRVHPVVRTAPARADGWSRATYTDGRPKAGWLTMNGLWLRYLSDGVSYGRGRANAVARLFLCADFLDRPIDFPRDFDLTDEEAIREAVRTNDGCIGCHASLDPLASHLAGFQYTDKTPSELLRYHPERERLWPRLTGLAPGFYGRPGYALTDLAHHIAADPRYVECLVERGFGLFLGRPVDHADPRELDALTLHRERLLSGGLTMRSLARSIVSDPRYALADEVKLVPPEMWSDVLFDLTGYRMSRNDRDVFATDATGLRSLAGGGDGRSGSAPASTPTATMALAWERSAEAAADYAVRHPAALFVELDPSVVPDAALEGQLLAQIARLHRRLFGTRPAPDSLEIQESRKLWDRLFAIEGRPGRAWVGLLTALLRDPTMVTY
jgi:hypothetical protein